MIPEVTRVESAADMLARIKAKAVENNIVHDSSDEPIEAELATVEPTQSAAKKLADLSGGQSKRKRKPVKGVRYKDIDLSIDLDVLTWSWKNRIPKGYNLLSGREGCGKSAMVDWLIWHYTTGTDWPDGQPCKAGTTLLFDSENSPERKLIKLEAIGCDMEKIEVLDVDRFKATGLNLVEAAKSFMEEHPDTNLIVIDLGRNMDTRLGEEDKKVDAALTEIKLFALNRIPCFVIHHEGKASEDKNPIDRVRGPVYWSTNARLSWTLAQNPAYGPTAVTVEVAKANDAPKLNWKPLLFDFENRVTPSGFEFGALRFVREIPLEEFQPVESAETRSKRGRKPTVPGEKITETILEVLMLSSGKMRGQMPAELVGETVKGSETWNSYCCNAVADRLGIAPDTVSRHFGKHLKGQTVGGHYFQGFKEVGKGGHWVWMASRDLTGSGDSNGN